MNTHDEQMQSLFFEGELDLCHCLLDVAGPKPTTSIVGEAMQGYETVLDWVGSLRDPKKFARVTTKLERLRERLLRIHSQSLPSRGLRA